jgi:hypothetical protein
MSSLQLCWDARASMCVCVRVCVDICRDVDNVVRHVVFTTMLCVFCRHLQRLEHVLRQVCPFSVICRHYCNVGMRERVCVCVCVFE